MLGQLKVGLFPIELKIDTVGNIKHSIIIIIPTKRDLTPEKLEEAIPKHFLPACPNHSTCLS